MTLLHSIAPLRRPAETVTEERYLLLIFGFLQKLIMIYTFIIFLLEHWYTLENFS